MECDVSYPSMTGFCTDLDDTGHKRFPRRGLRRAAEGQKPNWKVARILLDQAFNGRECADRFAASPSGFYDAVPMDLSLIHI